MDCIAGLLRVRSDSGDDHTIRLQLSDGDLCTMETDSVNVQLNCPTVDSQFEELDYSWIIEIAQGLNLDFQPNNPRFSMILLLIRLSFEQMLS